MEQILIQSDTPNLGTTAQEANLWRFHFTRKFFADTHGSLYIGSKEAAKLGEHFFLESLDCDGIVENDSLIKRCGPNDLGARVKLLHQMVIQLNTRLTARPALLFCKDGTGVSAAFAIAYILFINVHKFVANQETRILPVHVAINRVRSICADLYSVIPLLDMNAIVDRESDRKVHVGFRQVLDPTIPDHRLWLKAINVWYTKFSRSVVPKQLQPLMTRQLLGIPEVVKHHYCHLPERLRLGGGNQDDLSVVENKLGRGVANEQPQVDTFVEEFEEDDDTTQPTASLDFDNDHLDGKDGKSTSELHVENEEGDDSGLGMDMGGDDVDWADDGFGDDGDLDLGDGMDVDMGMDMGEGNADGMDGDLGGNEGADAMNMGIGGEQSIIDDINGAFNTERTGDEMVQLNMDTTGFDFAPMMELPSADFMADMPLPGEFNLDDALNMTFDSPLNAAQEDGGQDDFAEF